MDGKQQLESQISLQKVITSELGQLKNTAKVYHKQQNSDIFFLSNVEQEMAKAKNTVESLQEEYKAMEQQQETTKDEYADKTE